MIRILGALAAFTLIVAACGSDEDGFRDQFKELDPSFTDETVDCIIAELEARGLSVTDISDEALGDGPLPEAAQAAVVTCLSADSFSSDSSDTSDPSDSSDTPDTSDSSDTSDPSDSSSTAGTYGSDAELDVLWDACEAGDGAACDDLYFQAPVGSDYEDFGDKCGRRYEISPGFCEDALG